MYISVPLIKMTIHCSTAPQILFGSISLSRSIILVIHHWKGWHTTAGLIPKWPCRIGMIACNLMKCDCKVRFWAEGGWVTISQLPSYLSGKSVAVKWNPEVWRFPSESSTGSIMETYLCLFYSATVRVGGVLATTKQAWNMLALLGLLVAIVAAACLLVFEGQ